MAKVSFDRKSLRSAYLTTFDGFGVGIGEIGSDPMESRRLMRELMRSGLIVSCHVNDEKALTYQCAETSDGIDRATAIKRFQAVYGTRGPIERAARVGATGPRYSDEQITKAIAMRVEGASWKSIGAELGIKATAYLSKLLTPRVAEALAPAPAKKRSRRAVKVAA